MEMRGGESVLRMCGKLAQGPAQIVDADAVQQGEQGAVLGGTGHGCGAEEAGRGADVQSFTPRFIGQQIN